uniref:non-specific serine/threonine protein kinase n=1 Tax=Anthurium amnicola TaxID=1678845 RepID=A0A1D1ZIT1_9ARAE
MSAAKPPPSSLRALCLGLALLQLLVVVGLSQAQTPAPAPLPGTTQPTTDPAEARALNAIFSRWGLSASGWNLSGELCSGTATDTSDFDNDLLYNPTIKCDCSFDSGATCRITKLKIYALNVVGPFPQELQTLTQLNNLKLSQNYLTGPLPAFIGNLTSMQYLTVGINALSGTLPKELGNLQKLVSLGLASNNFNGSLPPELGNLTSLEQLYIDSAGLSGEIPSTFSKLEKLHTLWASDNDFTGRIPDFIGTLTSLTVLRFQGNSFQGPIPSSLANLTLMSDLRIGDILNQSSTLDFIQNMNSLTNLVIRNSKISDNIPSSFGQYTKLQLLDLSFNNLTGQLPESLFNLSSLQFLFLGNNSLSGSLPTQKSTSIQNIDLSYNQLSGGFPTWVSEQNLRLNLVANNFVLDDSNNSVTSSGLHCLQRNIPCNRDYPIYSSFGINCGGSKSITASDGTVYEIDDQNVTTASYYLTDTRKWGVSSIGRFMDSQSPSYTWSVSNQFPNTLDTELFQTARLSPSSLRYYGLGLENGNYTIKLQFAETAFPNSTTWQSVGRRIFNIYIQVSILDFFKKNYLVFFRV